MRTAKYSSLCLLLVLGLAFLLQGTLPQVPTGTWTATSSQTEARSGSAAVVLQDGRVLFTGGAGANGPLASAEFFNTDGSITPATSMQSARANHTAVVLPDGRVLVAGGTTSGSGIINAAEIYDPNSNAWTAVSAGMMVPRSGHTASLLSDGTVLIAGGQSTSFVSNTLEIFDPGTGAFTLAPDTLASPRQGHAAAVLQNGLVLIAGGSDGTNVLNSSDLYDPSTGLLNPGPTLLNPRQGLSATTQLDGRALVVGGNNGSADLASAEVYNPATGSFAATGPLSIARQGHLAFLLPHNGGIVIVGGTSSRVAQASAELYYPWTGAFNSTGGMASARSGAAGGPPSQDGLLLVAGGTDASGATLSSAELYGFATVKTDKIDYQPGEPVTITGSGWQPGETVTLSLVESPNIDTHPALTAVADGSGNIVNTQFSPDSHDLEVLFYLTATGSASQAQTVFTDGTAASGDGNLVVSPNIVAAGSTGNTLTFTFTATNGKDFNANSQAQITVPAGWPPPTPGNVTVTNGNCTSASLASATGNLITVNMVCPGGTNFTVTYSGATAPASAGSLTFNTQTKQGNPVGVLKPIGTSPSVTTQAASKLVFGQQPTNTQAGSSITPAVTVQVQDANGDVANTSSASITISLGANPSGGALGGTATVAAVNGVATFNNLSINKTGTGYTLSASGAGLTTATSSAFNITSGPATQLVFGQQPTNTPAGASITPVVTVQVLDANNNVVTAGTSSTAPITMAIGANPGGGTLGGTTTVNAVGGIANFNNLSINKVGASYTLTASSTGLTGVTSSTFNITAGAVSATASTVSANPASVPADGATTSTITVTLTDAGNNPVSGKTVTLSQGAGSSTISPANGVSNASGVVTFTVKDSKAEAVTYTATDTTDPVTITPTAVVTFSAGAVNAGKSTVSANPASVIADGSTTSTITVTLKDVNNNPVSGKTVSLAAGSGSSMISAASGSSNASGVVTFSVKDAVIESVTYTATDTTDSIIVTQTAAVNFTVGPVTAGASTVSANPASVIADGASTSTITVTLNDASNHPVSGKTVTLTAGSGSSTITTVSGTTNATGQATFTVKDATVETVIYTAKDTTDNVTVTSTATVSFTVGPVSPTTSTVSANPTSVVADGSSISTITVTLKDANNHPVSGKAVSFTAGGGSSTITTVSGTTNASGVATFTVKDATVESVTYTAKDTSDSNLIITQTAEVNFTIGPGDAVKSTVSANPASVPADGSATSLMTVTLKDVSNRAVSGKTVTLSQGAGSSTISAASGASDVNGVVTFTVKDAKAEAVIYTATDTTDTVTISQTATVSFTNPVPTTTSISPSSKNAGDAGFTLTVNGTNFVSASTVNFSGSARTTTFVNSTQMTVAITATDVATAGAFPITVTSPAPGGGTSNAQTLTVNPKLALTTTAFATLTGLCSPQMSAQIQNGNGSAATLATATILNLSSNSANGNFYSDAGCGTLVPGNTLTLAAGSSTASFFYKDTTIGSPVITVASTGLASLQQTEVITGLRFGSTAFTAPLGQCSAALSLQSANATSGNPTSLTQATSINLGSSSAGGKFYSDSTCTTQISSTTIGPAVDAGHDSPNFFYKDSLAGSLTLTGSAGTALATQAETISKATPVFSNLRASQSLAYGTPSVTLSGNIAVGTLFPPKTESVSITINSMTVQAAIGANGAFTTSFDTHAIPAAASAYTITYSYAADVNFNTAADTSKTLTVNKANTTTVVGTIAPEPSNINQQFSVSWTVSPVAPSVGTPAGTVSVNDGNGNTCSAPVASGSCSLASTSAGPKTVTATYSGDSNFNGSFGTKAHSVNNPTTSTTVTSSSVNNTSAYGDLVTFTATLTSAAGTPAGSVIFYDGGCGGTVLAGPTNLDVNGKASFGANTLSVTSHTITACYTPTGIFLASSGSVTQIVIQAAPVVVDNGPPASTFGQPATLSVTVTPPSGGTPTGAVTFSFTQNSTSYYVCADGSISTTQCTVPVTPSGNNYVASVTTSKLPTVAVNVMATYSGDTNFQGEPANNISVTVSQADSATTLTKSVDPSIYGDALDLTVKVKDNTANSTGVPTGTVMLSFKLDPNDQNAQLYYICADGSISTTVCVDPNQITLAADPNDAMGLTATATVHTTNLPAGLTASSFAYAINAAYSGDTNFKASGPFGLTQTVTQRPITVTAATDTKTYDGTASSSGKPTLTAGTLANIDTGTFTQSFDNRNAGTAKTLTPAGSVNDGFGGNNYVITFSPVSMGVINPLAITVTAVSDSKTYDGGTSSTGAPTITPPLVGGDTSSFTQTFDTRNAGTSKTLTPSGSASDGNGGHNYSVTFHNVSTGAINALAITVTAVTDSKTYDGTTSSSKAPAIAPALISGDTSGFTQVFDNRNAGTGKTLTPSGSVNDGNNGSNYNVTFHSVTTGTVSALAITVTAVTDTKTYDGNTNSSGVPTIAPALISPDGPNFVQNFDTRNAGANKTLTPSGLVNDGNGGSNYSVTFAGVNTGTISPLAITVTAVADTKTYDGGVLSAGTPIISPLLISPDMPKFRQRFDTKHAGSGKTLTPTGSVLDGNNGQNYAVTFATVNTGVINPLAITVTAVTDTKTYDGTTISAGVPTITPGLVGGDTSGFTETFDNKNAGARTLTPAGSVNDGNNGHNHSVQVVSVSGTILQRGLTITATTNTKTYDATTSAVATPAISGLQSSDTVTGLSETYDTATAGTGKTLSVASYTVNDGNSGGNYAVTSAADHTGVIIQAAPVVVDNGPPASTFGQPATLSVTVTPPSGGTPTGAVTFSFTQNSTSYYVCADGSISTTQCTVPVTPSGNNYVASVTTSKLPTAAVNVMATYSGDTNFQGEPANNISVTVSQADSATTLTKSVDPSIYGDALDLTVKVKDNTANSTGVPTGTVMLSFKLDPNDQNAQLYYICADGSISTTVCVDPNQITLAADSNDAMGLTATATVHTTNLPAGLTASSFAYAINAAYSGDTNFKASGPFGLTQTVTQRPITVTAATDTKTYDGTTSSSGKPTVTAGTLANSDTGTFTQSFDNRNAGTAKTLTTAGSVSDGFGGNNYVITFSPVSTGVIKPSAITVTAVADKKTYNGTTSSSGKPAIAPALISPDNSGFTQTFDSRNVGTGKMLTAAGTASDGNSGNNYAVTFVTNSSGEIDAATLTITAVTNTKTYDGTRSAAGMPAVAGLQSTDTVNGLSETYDAKSVGIGKALSVVAYTVNDGNGGHNYTVTPVADHTGAIALATLTVSATGVSKPYDNTTAEVVTLSDNRISGDVFTDSYTSASFADANAGNKPVSVIGISISGADAGNYTFNTTATTTANIAPATTTTNLTSTTNPSNWGRVAAFTATVAPQIAGTPTGTVVFYNAASGATCSALGASTQIDIPTLLNGIASTSTSALPTGTDTILGCYSGDANFVSSSNTLSQNVIPAPIAVVSPASVSFGNQQAGTTSGAQSVTVSNPNGTAPLIVSSIAITGTNATYFTQTNTCSSTVAVGGSCTISVKFSPTDTGAATAILTVTDNNENASGSQQSTPLTGAGTSSISSVGSLSTYAIFATANGCGSINGSGGITVDSFNSGIGYASSHQNGGGNVGTDGNVTVSGNAVIYGTAASPFTGSGSCSTKSMTGYSVSGAAKATGGQVPLSQPLTYPTPPAPNPAPPTSNQSISGSCGSILGCTNSGSKTVTLAPGQYGNLSLNGGTAAHVSKGTYNINSLTLSGNSELVVDSGPVVVNLAGNALNGNNAVLDLTGGSMSNTSGIPSNLQIYYGGSRSIKLSGGIGDYAVVYAPNAPINVSGGAHFYGSIVGSTVNDSGGTAIHYDSSLPSIGAGNYIWFNSGALNVQGLPATGSVKLYVTNSTIKFTANGTPYTLTVPNAVLTFSSTATSASTTWDSTNNRWNTIVPTSMMNGNAIIHTFLDGLAYLVPSNIPGGIQNATWAAAFSTDAPGISFQWQWGAAVYNSFTNTYAGLGVVPVDNADPAGTPESYKSALVFGSTGAGPTGWYVGIAGVVPTIAPASASPSSLDFSNGGTVSTKVGNASSSMLAVLTNNQSVPLNISGIQLTGTNPGDFNQTNSCPSSLAGGASCSITVTFTPSAPGKRTAKIAVNDDANNSPQTVFLKGTGQ